MELFLCSPATTEFFEILCIFYDELHPSLLYVGLSGLFGNIVHFYKTGLHLLFYSPFLGVFTNKGYYRIVRPASSLLVKTPNNGEEQSAAKPNNG